MAAGLIDWKAARIGRHIERYVEEGKFPGVACLVSRGGEEAYFHSAGLRDVERGRSLERDTIFRVYSMSKPVTSVALMMLYEEGRFQLDDPVGKYVESWADLEVFGEGDEDRYVAHAPDAPMRR